MSAADELEQIPIPPALRLDTFTALLEEVLLTTRVALESIVISFAEALSIALAPLNDATRALSPVPAEARRVRPVGGRSNSRTWLAWDHDRWRPCFRFAGKWWWTP